MRAIAAPALFATTLFLSSFLLFVSQPMEGKMLLPWLGGTPSVWNACMLFFQAVLLLGYLYAHLLSTKLKPRLQIVIHAAVLVLPFALLPPGLPAAVTESDLLGESPIRWLLFALAFSIGPAFFAISATSPLLQAWYFRTNEASGKAKNPYILYAAGNVGSLLALVAYPLVVEPGLAISGQATTWTIGYAFLVTMIMAAGGLLWASATKKTAAGGKAAPAASDELEDVHLGFDAHTELDEWASGTGGKARQRLWWILLAFVPSSLMLGVTTFLTTDIASIPMLWVLPLALYTLSFVMVFARYGARSDKMMSWVLPLFIVPVLFLTFTDYRQNLWLIITLHLAAFFAVAISAHGRLALSKPPPKDLTAFYFCMAVGGVLGGAFNTLVSPVVFTKVSEYPLMLIVALWVCRPRVKVPAYRYAMVAAAAGAGVMFLMTKLYADGALEDLATALTTKTDWSFDAARTALVYGVPFVWALVTIAARKPALTYAALAGVCVVAVARDLHTSTIHRSRSFFGTLAVRSYEGPDLHSLVHGGILHGEQWTADEAARAEPRSYYHKDGPLGQIMQALDDLVENPSIGAIGLGAGAVAAYGHRDNNLTFFELDPNVEKLARDPKLFTYVDDCIKRWCNLDIVIGDGRLKLKESEKVFDLIIVDAFSSDAIPVHLITLEALETYFSKMTASGIVAFHISNRYVNLEPVLLNLAKEMSLGYAVREETDDDETGRGASTWVILAQKEGIFEKIAIDDDRWRGLIEEEGIGVWRDDYANVARAFTWY